MRSISIAVLLAAGIAFAAPAQPPRRSGASESTAVSQVAELGKLWGAIKYHHPWLAYRPNIDWDQALITALPLARSARTPAEYARAVTVMLATLGDSATRVLEPPADHLTSAS